jgi:hypothetical protein
VVFKRRKLSNGERVWAGTAEFTARLGELGRVARASLVCALAGEEPDEWKTRLFFLIR